MKSKFEQALLLFQKGELNKAKEICLEILKVKPDNPDIYNFNGIILINLRQVEEAIKNWNKAIEINPNYVDAYYNRGNAFFELKKFEFAIESFDKAIQINPNYAEAYNNRGNAFFELKKFEFAIESFDKAIQINPNYAEAYYNRGNCLKNIKKFDESINSFNKAIKIKPDHIQAYNNLGNIYIEIKKLDSAIQNFDKAIQINPNSAETYYNRGNALIELKKFEFAIESFDKAIQINPNYAEAYKNRANLLVDLKKIEEAFQSYNKAIQIKPNLDYLLGELFFVKNILCDWSLYNENSKKLENEIIESKKPTMPFSTLSMFNSLFLQKICAEIFLKNKYSRISPINKIEEKYFNKKIRVGYYSPDFRNHPVSQLLIKMLELHDKSKFEIIGFSFGSNKEDELRKKISTTFDQFIDVDLKSDRQIAQISRDLKIDIAIDLTGFTKDNRFGIYLERCAPIQVSYLGYSGTTGSNNIDYIIGDKVLIPDKNKKFFSEKIIYLPNTFMVNDFTKKISKKIFSKEELGLPKEGFVFCSFNDYYKITPVIFNIWMKLLQKVKNSVLWLAERNSTAIKNLKVEASKRGVDSNRIIFAKRTKLLEDHLARHNNADLFLDTFPYNGHTTASDALWSGLPLVTLSGKTFASRVSASLLSSLDLNDLIASTEEEYENLIFELTQKPEKLKEIKEKLKENKIKKPTFNTELFTKNIELAYNKIYQRHLDNLPIDNLEIN